MLIKSNANYRDLIVGADAEIPLSNGQSTTYINFDNAATTPPFASVIQSIVSFAPWYSSIHRGTGFKSQYSSEIYEKSKESIKDFVKADPGNLVIFVKNTTEAINKLSYRLYHRNKRSVILSTYMEHHSNDLPWRNKYNVDYIKVDDNGRLSLEDLERKLRKYRKELSLVTVTGASNVTGYKNPIYDIAELVHKYDSKIMVDAAQLIGHSCVDMKPDGSRQHIDYLAFSAHKMYAPFGTGVLIGPKYDFEKGEPEYRGGGTIDIVTHDLIKWAELPDKEEAGTPNVMGVVALTEAVRTLSSIGMENLEAYESSLLGYALDKLASVPGIKLYCDNDLRDRVGIIPFNIDGLQHKIVADALSAESGIAVRNGCFCSQPYVQKLMKVSRNDIRKRIRDSSLPRPGMIRLSFGMYNNYDEIDVLVQKLCEISANKKLYKERYETLDTRH
ncbi:MAG: aminotransferase class V-fold PLP-dependent enzyme [Clostridiaceae bacterium]|nr:aminotransferase class V-fold PLP-dependent enzyme [Clostridiaceae bacterium]